MILGKDLIISLKDGNNVYQPIAASNSCDIDVSCDVKEISSPSSGVYREYVAGRKTWTVRVEWMVYTTDTVKSHLTSVGTEFELRMTVDGNANDLLYGDAILVQAQVRGSVGNILRGSWTFQGAGLLSPTAS